MAWPLWDDELHFHDCEEEVCTGGLVMHPFCCPRTSTKSSIFFYVADRIALLQAVGSTKCHASAGLHIVFS